MTPLRNRINHIQLNTEKYEGQVGDFIGICIEMPDEFLDRAAVLEALGRLVDEHVGVDVDSLLFHAVLGNVLRHAIL